MGCGSTPQAPNYGKVAKAGIEADLATYPNTYLINAAAATGGKVNVGGQTYDFTGLGDVDTAAQISDRMAQTLLDIQRETSGQRIAQRLAELQVADPEGYAARKQLFDLILASAAAAPDRPLATELQGAVLDELGKSGALDPRAREQVQGAVRGKQIRQGIILGNAPAAEESAAMVAAADDARSRRQAAAENFLATGVSPEDVEYRRFQQSLANLGAFTSGTTPIAQFRNLAGAQNLTTPYAAPANPAAFSQDFGARDAAAIYSGQVNWAANQVNPWMAGISTGISAGNVANAWLANRNTGTAPANADVNAWGAPAGTTYNAGSNTYQAPYTGWGSW